jgi:hypothetical protein
LSWVDFKTIMSDSFVSGWRRMRIENGASG